uniref:Reverse transcriptase domain-containing protein n=1 Tax=Hippocampus comes TaxID=109280 RepID=A0A3Q3D276_HIPCM
MNQMAKRKKDDEPNDAHGEWTEGFTLVERTGSVVCLIYNDKIPSMKRLNVKWRFDTRHAMFANTLRETAERKHAKLLIRLPASQQQLRVWTQQCDYNSASFTPLHLSPEQQIQVAEVKVSYSSLFKDKPGRTDLITHKIMLKENKPVRLRPSRIPEQQVEPLKQEVQAMLDMGIIEPSKSEWSNPIVLVPKKDSSQLTILLRHEKAQ